MKANNTLLSHMCDVIRCYQDFMVDVRYKGNKYDDPIWKCNRKVHAYGFVPTKDITELMRILITTFSYLKEKLKRENISFLDAGCGVGNILLIARTVGFSSVNGIEFDANTVEIAKKLLHTTEVAYKSHYSYRNIGNFRIIKADLSKYNKYKDYDVIYYYQPLSQHSTQLKQFLSLMKENMKIGSIVITNGTNPFKSDKKFKNIVRSARLSSADGVYEKMR